MQIAVLNKSKRVTNSDANLMAKACHKQVKNHVAPIWEKKAATVTFYSDETKVPAGAAKIYLFDDADQSNALGYHSETPEGEWYGRIFVGVVLDNGGTVLNGELSVSAVLSHEVLELYGDKDVNLWADNSNQNKSYAVELCDPVEADSYTVNVWSGLKYVPVSVSNFVTQEWFDLLNPKASKFDYLGKLSAPFTMTSGGYMIYRSEGKEQAVYGASYPEWKKAMKDHPASRTSKRTK